MLTDACVPQGSEAEIDPRLLESLFESEGLNEGLWEGETSALFVALIVRLEIYNHQHHRIVSDVNKRTTVSTGGWMEMKNGSVAICAKSPC